MYYDFNIVLIYQTKIFFFFHDLRNLYLCSIISLYFILINFHFFSFSASQKASACVLQRMPLVGLRLNRHEGVNNPKNEEKKKYPIGYICAINIFPPTRRTNQSVIRNTCLVSAMKNLTKKNKLKPNKTQYNIL